MNIHLNSEGQKCKTGHVRCGHWWAKGGGMERLKEGEWSRMATCVKIE
jgi:hypothetical protein